jgi:hypothetical protein
MKQLLNDFFQSDNFWQRFGLLKEHSCFSSYSVSYSLQSNTRKIDLAFFELEGVKSLTVLSDNEIIIKSIFFLNLDELILILLRVPEIRAANPLCAGSQSIKALSCSQKTGN